MMCEGIKKLNKSGFIFHGISFIISVYGICSEAVQNAPAQKIIRKNKTIFGNRYFTFKKTK